MTLGLVIPVYNDAAGVRQVLAQVHEIDIFDQVVIVDDASEQRLQLEDLLPADLISRDLDIGILRHESCRGAGAARNRGLAEIRTDHVLFFDADDQLRPELAELWHDLQQMEQPFDFCMFQHVEERCRQDGHWGMFPKDEELWHRAGANHPRGRIMAGEDLATLAQVAAYPWNKIYRVAFLRDHQIRCSETVVHNDIALHWRGFFAAEQVVYARLLGCEHILGQSRNHITHRHGAERLQLFQALEDVHAIFNTVSATPWRLAFACFYIDLIHWAQARIDPAFMSEFRQRARDFVARDLDAALFQTLNHHNPDLARRGLDLLRVEE